MTDKPKTDKPNMTDWTEKEWEAFREGVRLTRRIWVSITLNVLGLGFWLGFLVRWYWAAK